jgi:hypothetical protein
LHAGLIIIVSKAKDYNTIFLLCEREDGTGQKAVREE